MKTPKPKKHFAEQFLLKPIVEACGEPHIIVHCAVCDEVKHLMWERDGDGMLYYKCPHCGFESEADFGPAPEYIK